MWNFVGKSYMIISNCNWENKNLFDLCKTFTKKGGGDIGLCDESRIYGCLIETWVFN